MPASAQSKIEIDKIQDGVIVLKNGSLRAVLHATAINLGLKSTDEQTAIVMQFQNFLNSLEFPVQIMATSRKINIDAYLSSLEAKRSEQKNELLAIQISEYIDFVRNLVGMANIMDQTFYVIIPFSPVENKKGGLLESLLPSHSTTQQTLEEQINQLWQRAEFVSSALQATGVKTESLSDERLIQIFYQLYNPEGKEKPSLN